MTTPIFLTGFEGWPAAIVTSGGGLADVATGTLSVQGTIKRTGLYALRVNPASATTSYWGKNISGSPDTLVGRFYFRVVAWPSATYSIFTALAGQNFSFMLNSASHTLYPRLGPSDGVPSAALSLNTWYRVDFKHYCGASATIDWKLDGADQTQKTGSITPTGFTQFLAGIYGSASIDIVYDDIELSVTPGDYPIGPGGVHSIVPNGDGTHSNAANIIEDQAGNDIDGALAFAYSKINSNPIGNSTAYIRQAGNGTGNYAEVHFSDTAKSTIHGAMARLAYTSASTSGNTGGCVIVDQDTTETPVWGASGALADYSDGALANPFYKSALLPIPSGGWNASAVGALKARLGYSGDANPDPYWLDLIIEVGYYETDGLVLAVQDSLHGHSADNLDLVQHGALAVQESLHSHDAEEDFALVQHNTLVVQDALHAHDAEEDLVLTAHAPSTPLTVQESLHAHGADNLALVQHSTLTIQDGLHAHNADNLALVQHSVLAPADSLHAHNAEELVLVQHNLLVSEECLHAHAADELALVQHSALVAQEALHTHTAEEAVLVQHNALAIDEASHAHSAEEAQLAQHNILVAEEAAHAHNVNSPILVQHSLLAVDDTVHGHAADGPELVQHNALAVDDSLHAHDAANLELVEHTSGTLVIQYASHAQSAEAPVLTQHGALAVNETTHAQSAESVQLAQHNILVVQDASHAQTAEATTLAQHNLLAVQDTAHAHGAEEQALVQHNLLVSEDNAHAHAVDNAALTAHEPGALVVQESTHGHNAENVALTQHNALVVQDTVHTHSADNVSIGQSYTLSIADGYHAQVVDELILVQHHVLAPEDAVHGQLTDNVTLATAAALIVQDGYHYHYADIISWGGVLIPVIMAHRRTQEMS